MPEPEVSLRSPSKMRDHARFVQGLIRSPGTVGAIAPSSSALANAMVDRLDLQSGDLVVEYGPGTGPMTEALHRLVQRQPCVRYLGIELDASFVDVLSKRFPEFTFFHGSVADVREILNERELGLAKAVVSGLPFAVLPEDVQRKMMVGTANILVDGGVFRTFQYVHAYQMKAARRFRAMLKEQFGAFERSAAVMRNVPPAYILSSTQREG